MFLGCKNDMYDDKQDERIRVILDTDANNELDDQHAIAYLLLSDDVFNVAGITVNRTKHGGGIDNHYDEALRVVKLCNKESEIPIFKGADKTFNEIKDSVRNNSFDGIDAVNFIIEKSKIQKKNKLVLLPVGKLTNIALALYKEPSIANQVRIVWLGSNYPDPGEYNQINDLSALEYMLGLDLDFEIVTVRGGKSTGTAAVAVTREEIEKNMKGRGPLIPDPVTGRHGGKFSNFGDYSVSLFDNCEFYGDPPSRSLFDMAAVAIVKNPSWANVIEIPSPKLVDGNWIDQPDNSLHIKIWENFQREQILNDFYNTIKNYPPVK